MPADLLKHNLSGSLVRVWDDEGMGGQEGSEAEKSDGIGAPEREREHKPSTTGRSISDLIAGTDSTRPGATRCLAPLECSGLSPR